MDRKRCYVCKPIRRQDRTSDNDVWKISKPLALGIWEEGQPYDNWALYGRPICGNCRRYFEKKYLTNEMKERADTIFGK